MARGPTSRLAECQDCAAPQRRQNRAAADRARPQELQAWAPEPGRLRTSRLLAAQTASVGLTLRCEPFEAIGDGVAPDCRFGWGPCGAAGQTG
jgi:hypothetical protein